MDPTSRRAAVLLLAALSLLAVAPVAQAGRDGPGVERPPAQTQVIGGAEIDPPGKYGFLVAVVDAGSDAYSGLLCGGSLITPAWVMTSAHCFTDRNGNQNVPTSEAEVVLGRHDLRTGAGVRVGIAQVAIHPLWNGEGDGLFKDDIALLQLATPQTSFPLALLPTAADRPGWQPPLSGTVMGWGTTVRNNGPGTYPPEPHEVDVPFVGDAVCGALWLPEGGLITPGAELCAGNDFVDSCVGDSGGPLIVPPGAGPWRQIGIVSSGNFPCASGGLPGIYTVVAAFRSWITLKTAGSNAAPAAVDDVITVREDAIAAADLFGNDADPEGELLRTDKAAISPPVHGFLAARADGTWDYVPDPDYFGPDGATYTVIDSAGALSNVATVSIDVLPVNDAPDFSGGGHVTVTEDSGAYDRQWATGILAGPPNESSQVLDFRITGNSNPGLFAAPPAISPAGRLTFTPAADASGSSLISVRLFDDGGRANGGVDRSPIHQFRINVTAVNDAPLAGDDAASVADGGRVDIDVLQNDSDRDGDPLTVTVTRPPARGTAIVLADQKVRYEHDGSGPAADSFDYVVSDGSLTSAPATVSVIVGDRDSDGVPAEVEDGAPGRGDGNGDGIPDRDQSHVASLPSAVAGTYVTIVSPRRTSLLEVTALAPPGTVPDGVDFPVGLFSYDVAGVGVGEPVTVRMLLHGGLTPDTFYKYGPTRADPAVRYHRFVFDRTAGPTGASLSGTTVRLQLIDGEDGDADLTQDGVVRDPGGPAVVTTRPDLVGLVDPGAVWHLRRPDRAIRRIVYGNPGDVPLMGDWDCDGVDTPGQYRQSDGFVYLRNSTTTGVADIRFFFGDPADVPLAGDWDGDGCDTISVYRPANQRFFIINELGANNGGLGAADFSFVFGDAGDRPFSGDLDGDGADEVALHRPGTGLVYYRLTLTTGVADRNFIWGNPADVVFAGDWTGDGTDTVGLYRPSDATFYLRHVNRPGVADETIRMGAPGWRPVAGRFFG